MMDWADVEARVGAQCGRPLRLFASGSAADADATTVTTGDALSASEQQPQRPLCLFLELPYALRMALGARVDVWLQTHHCSSKGIDSSKGCLSSGAVCSFQLLCVQCKW